MIGATKIRNLGVGLMTVIVLLAAPWAPAAGTPSGNLTSEARVDLSDAARQEFEFAVPAGEPYAVVFDHATNALRNAPVPRGGPGPADATGCVVERPFLGWRVNPPEVHVPGASCIHEFHHDPIDVTFLVCPPQGTCVTDGINFNFVFFGFYLITCTSPGAAAVNWDADGPTQQVNCLTFVFGTNPARWDLWDSFCTGAGAGPVACLSTFE